MKNSSFNIVFLVSGVLMCIAFSGCSTKILSGTKIQNLENMTREEILSLSNSKIDLATAILILEKERRGNIDVKTYRDEIDEMAWQLKHTKKINTRYMEDAIATINKFLFEEQGFRYVDAKQGHKVLANHLFMSEVLDNKQGHCLSLSILYMSIAERLRIPCDIVFAPDHAYVQITSKGMVHNIETTAKGASAPFEWYLRNSKMDYLTASKSGYFKPVGKRYAIAAYCNNLAGIYIDENKIDEGIYWLSNAIEINPNIAEYHYNLAIAYLIKDEYELASKKYQDAIAINPLLKGNTYFLDYLEIQRALKRYYDEVEQEVKEGVKHENKYDEHNKLILHCENAIRRDKQYYYAYFLMGSIYKDQGKIENAIQSYQKALEIKPDYSYAHRGLAYVYFDLKEYDKSLRHAILAEKYGVSMSTLIGKLRQRK